MMTTSTLLTADQYLMLGEDPPGIRLELVHGKIYLCSKHDHSYEHCYARTQLQCILANLIYENDLGAIVGDYDVILDNANVRRPDIIFIAKENLHRLDPKKHGIRFPPDLCVEIISPGSATMDQTDKFDLYAKSGVPHYWLVDPLHRTFTAYSLTRKRYFKTTSGTTNDTVSALPFAEQSIPLSRLWVPERP
ncbi:MAG: Uma2 family endonuclease [Phycisphaerales bacterium]|nr:Uma2 family endonuclease [Phycisphaerales bacterium]